MAIRLKKLYIPCAIFEFLNPPWVMRNWARNGDMWKFQDNHVHVISAVVIRSRWKGRQMTGNCCVKNGKQMWNGVTDVLGCPPKIVGCKSGELCLNRFWRFALG